MLNSDDGATSILAGVCPSVLIWSRVLQLSPMNKIIECVQFVRRNFIASLVIVLLAGTGWITFAITYALFRDTMEPAPLRAPAIHRFVDSTSQSYHYWFRQRRLPPYSAPIEHAQNDQLKP